MTSALNSTVHQRGAASPAPRRKRLSTTERLALLERENATCHLCKGIIQPGQAWDVSHEIPLELGGADRGPFLVVTLTHQLASEKRLRVALLDWDRYTPSERTMLKDAVETARRTRSRLSGYEEPLPFPGRNAFA